MEREKRGSLSGESREIRPPLSQAVLAGIRNFHCIDDQGKVYGI
jgi:hypothetical protein